MHFSRCVFGKKESVYYGQFDPPVDRFVYERYFKNRIRRKGYYIECGAFDGVMENSCKFFEESLHWAGANLEPNPSIFSKLVKNRPNATNLNCALSNVCTSAKFTAVIHPIFGEDCTNGSLKHTAAHKSILDEIGCTYKEYTVDVIDYPTMIERLGAKSITLFVLDVEGNEANVIESMKNSKVLPEYFCVEFGHADKESLIEKVVALGYHFDTTSFVNAFFIRDAIYKRLSPWRKARLAKTAKR